MHVSRARFESFAEDAFADIPDRFRKLLVNVSLEVRLTPGPEAGKWNGSDSLLGLYSGLSRADMLRTDAGSYLPARVILYQRNLQRGCTNEAELETAIRTTVRHELAHHFGFSDAELKEKWPEGA